jgi:hypothetical protein
MQPPVEEDDGQDESPNPHPKQISGAQFPRARGRAGAVWILEFEICLAGVGDFEFAPAPPLAYNLTNRSAVKTEHAAS